MAYLLRPLLHLFSPERAHTWAIRALKYGCVLSQPPVVDTALQLQLFGRNFPNPVGLAAGFDKNAEVITTLQKQGFGFIEVGTVTPLAQEGNPQPRIFRLPEDKAVINRLGFNNSGMQIFAENLKKRHPASGIVGANIGRNKDSQDAVRDYVTLLEAVYGLADYVTINISSPNTSGLRDMQQKRQLTQLLQALFSARRRLADAAGAPPLPLLLKIAPDIDLPTKEEIAEVALELGLDGMIISNTTIRRPTTLKNLYRSEAGGLSGAPLFELSTQVLSDMYRLTQGKIPLIGVGGIGSGEEAYAKIRAGASLVQLYTALTYQGFGLVRQINLRLLELLKRDGFAHIQQAIGTGVTKS